MRPTTTRRLVDLGVPALVALVVVGPALLHRGYVLRGDLVFVPDMPWKGAWLGLDGRVPRFVPGDAFLALAGAVLPGDLVQKLVLLAIFVLGGCGLARMLEQRAAWPRAAGVVFFLWNPWVLERLAVGQWGIVVGYALLPWAVLAAERVRDEGAGWPALVVWLGVAAVFSPASGLVALAVVLAVLAVGPRRAQMFGALAGGLVMNLPWIVPALVTSAGLRPAESQFDIFAPRAESGLGTAASVLSLGGVWKTSIVPGERMSAIVVGLSLVLTLVAVLGLRRAARVEWRRVLGLGCVAVAALLLALLTAIPAVAGALDDLSRAVAAVGLVRDSHRFLGPLALVLALGLASAVEWLRVAAVPGLESLRAVAVALVLVPAVALPSLAWGLGGLWRPVAYPAEWSAVRDQLPGGRMVVLPWSGSYRGFSWNGRHAGLDPAPRFFPGDVLVDDRVLVDREVVASEDPLLDGVRRALAAPDAAGALRRLGVRSVLVEKANGAVAPDLEGARVLHDGSGLRLVDLGAVAPTVAADLPGRPSAVRRWTVVGLDVAVLVGWLVTGCLALAALVGRRRARPCMVAATGEREGEP